MAKVCKQDKQRQAALVKSLRRSEEQAHECWLYLTTNDKPPEHIAAVALVLGNISEALVHLGQSHTEGGEIYGN